MSIIYILMYILSSKFISRAWGAFHHCKKRCISPPEFILTMHAVVWGYACCLFMRIRVLQRSNTLANKVRTCIYLYMHLVVHAFIFTCIYLCMHLFVHAFICACIYLCMHLFVHAFICACIYLYMHLWIHGVCMQ